jgi:hypothetical protein
VAFEALRGVVVHELKLLANHNRLFERKERAVAVHGLRMSLNAELFAFHVFSVNGERHSQSYAKRTTAFFDAKMKQRHRDNYLGLLTLLIGLRITHRTKGSKFQRRLTKTLERMDRSTEESSTNLVHTGVSVPLN